MLFPLPSRYSLAAGGASHSLFRPPTSLRRLGAMDLLYDELSLVSYYCVIYIFCIDCKSNRFCFSYNFNH